MIPKQSDPKYVMGPMEFKSLKRPLNIAGLRIPGRRVSVRLAVGPDSLTQSLQTALQDLI
jgi:hypothetical protein